MEMWQSGRKKRILEDRGGEKMPYMWSEGRIEHILTHTGIKIGVGAVLDERGKRKALG